MAFGYPRVPAGFSFELGPSRAWARFQNSGSNTPKSSKKRRARARVGLGPRPAPPLLHTHLFFSIVPLLSNFSLHPLALNILVYCSWCCGCIAVVYIVYLGLKIDFPKDRFIGKRCYALCTSERNHNTLLAF